MCTWKIGFLGLLALTVLGGCAKTPPPPPSMEAFGVQRSTAELRVLLNEYLRWFTTSIAEVSNSIVEREDDFAVKEAALKFKVNLALSMQAAVFQRDPVAALADAWALTWATARFVETGAGAELFGGSQSVALDAVQALERDILTLVVSVVGSEATESVRPDIEQWVRDNPIRDLTFVVPAHAMDIALTTAAKWRTGGLVAVAQLDEMLRDLSDRLTIYAELLPALARWQAELLLFEAQQELLAKPLSDLSSVRANVDTLTGFITATPELIASERALVLETLATEREELLRDIGQQRRETLTMLTSEREAITAAAEELRQASFADFGRETDRQIGRIDEMRSETLAAIDQSSKAAIDHLFWRSLQLLVVALVGVGLLLLLVRVTRREPSPSA